MLCALPPTLTSVTSLFFSCLLAGSLTAAEVVAPAATAPAVMENTLPSDGELLAAARSASTAYQNHLDELAVTLTDPNVQVRTTGLRSLGRLQDPVAVAQILRYLEQSEHTNEELVAAALALGTSDQPSAIPALRKLSANGDEQIRLAAYNALGSLHQATAGDHTQRAKDSSELPHLAALTNLGTIKQGDAAPLLTAGLQRHPRAIVRRMCAIGLGKLGDAANGPALQNALSDADPGVRRYAAESIAAIGYRPAIPFIIFALDANISGPELAHVLHRMTGQDFGFDSHADELKRKAAIERGFAWWTLNSKDGG